MPAPLCFILTSHENVYRELIVPAVYNAGLEPFRPAPQSSSAAIFEQMLLCPFAVVDMTGWKVETLYYLGVREAWRPATAVLAIAEGAPPPAGQEIPRPIVYQPGSELAASRPSVTKALARLRKITPARPIFHFLETAADHTKTDAFREQFRNLEPGSGEAAALVDRLLSYRAASAWSEMVEHASSMPLPLARTVLVREQTAWALNRLGRRDEAERILLELIQERGPMSETCAILGRVYKDRWDETRDAACLDKAIDAYLAGFEADPRDAYPGVNAVTLMEVADPPDHRQTKILPVVRFAVERKIAQGRPDYWDYATLLEIAILAEDQSEAEKMLAQALAVVREPWEPATTARNLRLIREARARRVHSLPWADAVEQALAAQASAPGARPSL
ncbi:MAG TPA: TRAFs-binding domain-containing protein [Bryobacteraceae bacterium]|nr:TRAFs-binding domain-containing protein [Bryobacteraceae bacterium]